MGASCLRSMACSEKWTATCCATAMLVISMNCEDGYQCMHYGNSAAEEPYLLNQVVGLSPPVLTTVNGHAIVIQLKGQTQGMGLHAAVLEAARTKLSGDIVKDLDVMCNASRVMLGDDGNISEGLAVDDILCVGVRKLRRGPVRVSDSSHCTISNSSLDDGPPEPLLDDLRVLSHSKDDRERKAVLARQKTADLLAQRRR